MNFKLEKQLKTYLLKLKLIKSESVKISWKKVHHLLTFILATYKLEDAL